MPTPTTVPASSHTTTRTASVPMEDEVSGTGRRLSQRQVEKRKAREMERKSQQDASPSDHADAAEASGDEREEPNRASDEDAPVIETKAAARTRGKRPYRRSRGAHSGLDKAVGDWLKVARQRPLSSAKGPTLADAIRLWLLPAGGKAFDNTRLRAGMSELMPRLCEASVAEREQIISAIVAALGEDPVKRDSAQSSITRLLVRSGRHLGDALQPIIRQFVREIGPSAWRTRDQFNNNARYVDASLFEELLTHGNWPHCADIWLGLMQELPDTPAQPRTALLAQWLERALDRQTLPRADRIPRHFVFALASLHGGADMSERQLDELLQRLLGPREKPVMDTALRSAFQGLCEALSLDGWHAAHRAQLVRAWLAPPDEASLVQRTAWMLPGLLGTEPTRQALRELLAIALPGAGMAVTSRHSALLLAAMGLLRDATWPEPQAIVRLAPELGVQLGRHLAGSPGAPDLALAASAAGELRRYPQAAARGFMAGLAESLFTEEPLAGDRTIPLISVLINKPGTHPAHDFWEPLDERQNPHAFIVQDRTPSANGALEGLIEGLLRRGGSWPAERWQALARTCCFPTRNTEARSLRRHPLFHELSRAPVTVTAAQIDALVRGWAEGTAAEGPHEALTEWSTAAACATAASLRGARRQALVDAWVLGLGAGTLPQARAAGLLRGLCRGLDATPGTAAQRAALAELFLGALGGSDMPKALAWTLMRVISAPQDAGGQDAPAAGARALEGAARHLLGEAAFQAARAQAGIHWDRPDRFASVPAEALRRVGLVASRSIDAKDHAVMALLDDRGRQQAFEAFQSRYVPELDAAGWLREAIAMGRRLGVHQRTDTCRLVLGMRLARLRQFAAESDIPLGHDPVLAGLMEATDSPPGEIWRACLSVISAVLGWPRAPGESAAVGARLLACAVQTLDVVLPRRSMVINTTGDALRTLPSTQPVQPEELAGWVGTVVDALDLGRQGDDWQDLVAAMPGWQVRYSPQALRQAAAAVAARLTGGAGLSPSQRQAMLSRLASDAHASPRYWPAALQAVVTGLCPTGGRTQAFLQAVRGLGLAELKLLMQAATGPGTGADPESTTLFEQRIPTLLAAPQPGAAGAQGDALSHAEVRRISLAWFLGRNGLPDSHPLTLAQQFLAPGDRRPYAQNPWQQAAFIAGRPSDAMRLDDLDLPGRRQLLLATCAIRESQQPRSTYDAWSDAVSRDLPDTSKSGALVTLAPLLRYSLTPADFRLMRLQLMDAIDGLQARLSRDTPPLTDAQREDLELRITEVTHDLAAIYLQFRSTSRIDLDFLDAELEAVGRPHVPTIARTLLTTAINTVRQPLLAQRAALLAFPLPAAPQPQGPASLDD